MANNARNAILRALIEGVLTDLMVKTNVTNVYVDDNTTLAAKLAEIITSLNSKVSTSAMNDAISAAISDLIGGAPETYDTLKEISDYISAHEDVVTALNAAIGNKAEKSTVESISTTLNSLKTTVDGLGALAKKSTVSETDLDAALKEKVNAASEGNHSHSNKAVLDGITAEKVAGWDGKGRLLISPTQPSDMTSTDLWAQLV